MYMYQTGNTTPQVDLSPRTTTSGCFTKSFLYNTYQTGLLTLSQHSCNLKSKTGFRIWGGDSVLPGRPKQCRCLLLCVTELEQKDRDECSKPCRFFVLVPKCRQKAGWQARAGQHSCVISAFLSTPPRPVQQLSTVH